MRAGEALLGLKVLEARTHHSEACGKAQELAREMLGKARLHYPNGGDYERAFEEAAEYAARIDAAQCRTVVRASK